MKVGKKAIAKFQAKEQRVLAGRAANMIQDRKTGEMYDPKAAFDRMMNKPEIQAVFQRLSIR